MSRGADKPRGLGRESTRRCHQSGVLNTMVTQQNPQRKRAVRIVNSITRERVSSRARREAVRGMARKTDSAQRGQGKARMVDPDVAEQANQRGHAGSGRVVQLTTRVGRVSVVWSGLTGGQPDASAV